MATRGQSSRSRLVLLSVATAPILLGILLTEGRTADSSHASTPKEAPVVWQRLDRVPIEGSARKVARDFIVKAGFQTNVPASWELLDRTYEMRDQFTKATWTKGNVPVRPISFPFENLRAMRFDLYGRTDDSILLDVALFAGTPRPDGFNIGLKRRGQSWLVEFWACRYPCRGRPGPE